MEVDVRTYDEALELDLVATFEITGKYHPAIMWPTELAEPASGPDIELVKIVVDEPGDDPTDLTLVVDLFERLQDDRQLCESAAEAAAVH